MIKYILAAAVLLVLYGVFVIVRDMNRFVITSYEVKSKKIKDKYTFVMLSDLHNQSFGKKNDKLAEAIKACHPDSVMVAGDMYTSKEGSGYENALELLRALAKVCPVYLANGNHEHKTKESPEVFDHMYERYTKELKAFGLEPLVNEHLILPEHNLDICGLQIGREFFRHFKKREMPSGYVADLAGEASKNRFQILLAHNPIYFQEYAKWGADLVLSGHVHGGIIRLPFVGGVVSPAATLFPKYDGGKFTEYGSTMILGRGLGTHTIPVRMWNPGEVVLVTLLPADK